MGSNYESLVDMCSSSLMNQIRTFNEEQLRLLLDDNRRIDGMIEQMPQFSTLRSDKETRLIMCKSMAESNLAMEPTFNQSREKLNRTLNEVRGLIAAVKSIEAEVGDDSGPQNLETTSALLQAAAQTVEDESERLSDKLLDGDIEVDDFIKDFEKKRIRFHLRKIKAEKLIELSRQPVYTPQTAGSRPYSQPIYPHPAAGYRQSGAFMYPTPAYRNSGFM
ncbi:unnamed protein product [Bursaphelenchus xylophilus]|uniref:(pine wood nematode) hypothetical protein n=1 Tax=Bursaphelenchus xylophilus TaxID=6326 RepID=A0A1I7RTQ0_BURXY|nr:unnamed protein product [Bursaphelenchus xylophilus]CAG9122231.1 unnamed protein product [Bursaphelenchus xylophilus]